MYSESIILDNFNNYSYLRAAFVKNNLKTMHMFKKSNLIASAAYVSPMCKFVTTHPRKLLCSSPGAPGEDLNDDNTRTYEDDL